MVLNILARNKIGVSFSDLSLEDRYLYQQVAKYIFKYPKLLLSYSGGIDSTVLLDILINLIRNPILFVKTQPVQLPFYLRVIHIHHGLSDKSNQWAAHCRHQCKIYNIPFYIFYINCDDYMKNKNSIEYLCRKLRYQALFNFLNKEEVLLTAHHMDDQVETLLLALKRGSGPAGLSGMKTLLLYNNTYQLLRPLLECTRTQLQNYAYRRQLIWIEDDTNMKINFDRNFLRIKVIPLLQKRWPAFKKVVVRTALLCKNQEDLLHELLSESLNQLIDVDGSLFFLPLLKYSMPKRQVLLRYWLSNFFVDMPSYRILNCIWQEVVLSRIDAKPMLRIGKKSICSRFRNKLYIFPVDMVLPLSTHYLPWNSLNQVLLLPNRLGLLISQSCFIKTNCVQKELELFNNIKELNEIFFYYFQSSGMILTSCLVRIPKFHEVVSIQFNRLNNELLYILNRNHGRKLKKIWQEYNIPPWLRNYIPLLYYNHILISAIGVFITKNGNYINNFNYIKQRDCFYVKKIIWMQEISRFNFFKHVTYNVLK